ncbi:MAG: HAMP domain-containing sensor histidine kinase, partial [Gemmatimonadota bacterium]
MPGSVAAALVVLCTPGGEVLECRRDDLGAGAAEAVGRPFSTVVDGSSVQRVERLFGDIREEGASFNRDLRVKLRDGRRETVHVMGGRVDDDRVLLIGARSPAGLVGLSGELLELNAKQAALLRSLHDRRTAGRPSDFAEFARMNNELVTAQRQLVKTNAALAEASKEKNRLIGMASHDLRSPLAVIRSLSDVLLDRDLSVDVDRRRELLERIRRSSDFMLSLIDEMLQLTTIDAGEMRLTRKPTDIAGLVREAVDVQAVLADDKDIRIRTRLASGLPEIEVDGRKLEQVLSNLIGNAIKFSDRGR